MGLSQKSTFIISLLALLSGGTAALAVEQPASQILFLMRCEQIPRALEVYQNAYADDGKHKIELLSEIGLQILFEGAKSRDPETFMMTLYGAGISANERALPILVDGLKSAVPQHQLVALNFLARFQNDSADAALMGAMRSDYLPIRLEAALHLCEKQYPGAVGQTESLMHKVPPELLAIFPQIFAASASHSSTRLLKQLMNNNSQQVRISAVLSAAKAGRDDLLPHIRTLMSQLDIPQQEACAFAVGHFQDEQSRQRLQALSNSKTAHTRLAALAALHRLGDGDAAASITSMAQSGNLFAITLCSDIPGSEGTLKVLMESQDIHIRVNAALALLAKGDCACIRGLGEFFLHDSRDLAFGRLRSQGGCLTAWKAIPSASQNLQNDPVGYEMSLALRESILAECIELPEEAFLSIAHSILRARQNDLVPMTVQLLENMQTAEAINLLKIHSQQVGAPLIRNYCNLALYRMREEGPYFDNLKIWIREQVNTDLIRFRPLVPTHLREKGNSYQLTPEESSRLLVESFESFVRTHDERGIDVLFEAICKGSLKNRYALAGLLIQTTL